MENVTPALTNPARADQAKPFLPACSAVDLDPPMTDKARAFGSERGNLDNQPLGNHTAGKASMLQPLQKALHNTVTAPDADKSRKHHPKSGRKAQQEDVNPFSHSTVQRTTKANNKLSSLLRITIPINTLPSSVSPFLAVQLSQPHKAAAVAPPVRTIQQPVTQISTDPVAPLDQADDKKVEFQRVGKLKYKIKGLRLPAIAAYADAKLQQEQHDPQDHHTKAAFTTHMLYDPADDVPQQQQEQIDPLGQHTFKPTVKLPTLQLPQWRQGHIKLKGARAPASGTSQHTVRQPLAGIGNTGRAPAGVGSAPTANPFAFLDQPPPMPEWATHALNAAKAATVNARKPFTAANVVIAADAAAAAVAELAWQGQSWEPDSLQEPQVPSADAAHAAGCLWPLRRRGPRGGSLRVVQEQEALQQLEDHIAEQELEHQEALLQQGFADRAAAARRGVERECASGSICSGSVQQPRRADDRDYVPDQSAHADADMAKVKKKEAKEKEKEDNKLVAWPAEFEPRDPTMPHTRLDIQSLPDDAEARHKIVAGAVWAACERFIQYMQDNGADTMPDSGQALLGRIFSLQKPVLQLDGITVGNLRLLLEPLELQAGWWLHACNNRVDYPVAGRTAKKMAYLQRMRELRAAQEAGM